MYSTQENIGSQKTELFPSQLSILKHDSSIHNYILQFSNQVFCIDLYRLVHLGVVVQQWAELHTRAATCKVKNQIGALLNPLPICKSLI